MRNVLGVSAAVVAVVAMAPAAVDGQVPSQGVRGLGSGPSRTFETNLPTGSIARTLGDASVFTTGASFFGTTAPQGASYLAAPGIVTSLRRSTWEPLRARVRGPGESPARLSHLQVRTIDSLRFEKRARFATLRKSMFALAERIREADAQTLGEVSTGFRQLMFPIPVTDRAELGYGFFSRLDLVDSGQATAEALVTPFTEEVQRSLGEEPFLDAVQALLAGRPMPEGATLDQFYDPQLAALGNYLFNARRYRRAAEVWQTLAKRDVTSGLRRRALALAYLATGRLEDAAKEARASLERARGWPDETRLTGSNLQDVFPDVADLAEIRAELRTRLEKNPGDADLQFLAAWVDLFHGQWEAAKERLAKLAPADETARKLRARLEAGAADETLRRPAAGVLRQLAEDLTGLEEPALTEQERRHLIDALRTGAEGYPDYMRLGDFRFYLGDYTLAAEAYRAAHKARPEDPFALFALVHASFANGEYRLASNYLRRALALEPDWGLYEFRLQEFYGDREELARHRTNLERLVSIRNSATDMKFLLAYIHYFTGRYADAADLLAEVIRDEPDFERAGDFLRLARIQG